MVADVRSSAAWILALGALLLAAPAAPAAAPDLKAGPAKYPKVAVTHDVPIRMSDGATLYADVYRPANASGTPAPGKLPAILTQTPYNKSSANSGGQLGQLAGYNELVIRHGYVQV